MSKLREWVPLKRETFGRLAKTEAAAKRKIPLAESHGWDELKVEKVDYAGTIRYKVTGIPFDRINQEMGGTKAGPVNAPRAVSSKRRKGQAYRHGGQPRNY